MKKIPRRTLRPRRAHRRTHPMHGSHKVGFMIIGTGAFLTFVLIVLQGLLAAPAGAQFQGPSGSAGTGSGALGLDPNNKNFSIGTSTPVSDTKLLILASSSASAGFSFKVVQPGASTTNGNDGLVPGNVLFLIRNDGKIGIGGPIGTNTSTVVIGGSTFVNGPVTATGFLGPITGTVSANNVSAGAFGLNTGGGNYSFPANVGIGTTTPAYPLDISKDPGSNTYVVRINSTRATAGQNNGLLIQAGSGSADAPLAIQDKNGNVLMYLLGNGNVGIATSSPAYKLDVAGNGRFTSDLYANAFYYNSDRNLKTNIQPAGGLDTILKLNGVAFEWKKDGRRDVGLVAQDVEKVLPELVSTDAATGLKSVKYGNLVAPLIEAVKELNAKIESQEQKIGELEHEIEILRSK